MYEKSLNKSAPSYRIVIDRLKKEGMPLINEIEYNLMTNDPNENTLKKLNKFSNKNNEIRNHNRVNYSEAKKFICKFNKNMKRNLVSYNKMKKDNIIFAESFNKLKKINEKKLPSLQQEKINFIFGGLINKYDKKGFEITTNDFNKDIYKENGLLIGNSDLNNFYKYDFITNKNEKKRRVEKNINFLSKINKQAQILYNKILIEQKNLEEENEKFIFFNNSNKAQFIPQKQQEENKPENKPKPEPKRHNLFNFMKNINIIIRETKEEKTEIKKLKKLILDEEKKIMILNRKIREQNKKFIEKLKENSSFERNPEGKRTRTINPIMSYHFGKKNKSEIKDDKNESKLIQEEIPKIKKENNINNISLQSNSIKNINNSQSESTNISNNFHLDLKNKRFLQSVYKQFSLSNIIKRRLTTLNFLIFNNSNSTNSTNSVFINLRKNRRTSLIMPIMKRTLTVNDIYEKISNLDFISLKKGSDKKREEVTVLLKKYYGKNYQDFNKKNNHIKILRNCERIKEEIIKSENKNTSVKYKNELPILMQNKIEHNLEQNEKLKNYRNDFIISFYDKKLND